MLPEILFEWRRNLSPCSCKACVVPLLQTLPRAFKPDNELKVLKETGIDKIDLQSCYISVAIFHGQLLLGVFFFSIAIVPAKCLKDYFFKVLCERHRGAGVVHTLCLTNTRRLCLTYLTSYKLLWIMFQGFKALKSCLIELLFGSIVQLCCWYNMLEPKLTLTSKHFVP